MQGNVCCNNEDERKILKLVERGEKVATTNILKKSKGWLRLKQGKIESADGDNNFGSGWNRLNKGVFSRMNRIKIKKKWNSLNETGEEAF